MRRIHTLLALLMMLAAGPTGTAPSADQTPQPQPLGAISGVVVDATTGKPVAGAIVQIAVAPTTIAPPPGVQILISGSPFRPSRQITDALGRFVFTDVPGANSYTLVAIKHGYFDGAYGRRGMPGVNNTPRRITLAHGQWARDVKIEMLKPAVISGVVRNEAGEPLVGVAVWAYVDIFIGGARQLASAANAITDDRGEYRFANLAPGRYVVAVPSTQHSAPADLLTPPPALPQDALSRDSAFRVSPSFALDPVHRLMLPANAPPLLQPTANGNRQAYPLTFHPAARAVTDATAVEVGAGDDKASIDVQLMPVPVYRVSGRLDRQGDAVVRMSLRLMAAGTENLGRGIEQATAMVAADGSFTFLHVPVGTYTLIASRAVSQYSYLSAMFGSEPPGGGRGSLTSAPVFAAPPGTMLMRSSAPGVQFQGRQTVVVANRDVMGVAVPLESSVTMSGRIVYDVRNPETRPVPVISIEPATGDLSLGQPRAVRDVDDDPSYFFIDGILPGSYLLKVMTSGTLKSVKWGDKDYTDTPIEVGGGKITGVIVTVTDRLTTLAGTIRDRAGQLASNSGVVIFPVDRAQWKNFGNQPSRIRYVAGSTTGSYSVRGLPAGDYLIVGIDDGSASRWQDPAFFEAAARVATRFSIDWAESKTMDVVVQEIR